MKFTSTIGYTALGYSWLLLLTYFPKFGQAKNLFAVLVLTLPQHRNVDMPSLPFFEFSKDLF